MASRKTLLTVAGIVALFTALVAAIVVLLALQMVSFPLAMLMLVALFAMYLGFGVLIAVYRFVSRLQ